MNNDKLKLVVPKGKIFEKVKALMEEAGYGLSENGRNYRPKCNMEYVEIKMLKPQNIAKLVELGQHDIGFTGYDWVYEKEADVEELMDLKFDPVDVVVAMPKGKKEDILKKDKIIIASEYPRLTQKFLQEENLNNAIYLQTYGATEVFPPEDADMIIDNTATGKTLQENDLEMYKKIMRSSTRFIANKDALKDPWKNQKINEMKMMIESVLLGRQKLILEMNVSEERLQELVGVLPCMKSPTINKLFEGGYAVKVAIEKKDVARIVPVIKKAGATDILEFDVGRVVL